jgi:hypothetical protein
MQQIADWLKKLGDNAQRFAENRRFIERAQKCPPSRSARLDP